MNIILKLLLSLVAVGFSAYITPGVNLPSVSTTSGLTTLAIVTIVLALLNTFIKPIIKLLALPITILTLGLFLFVINALIVLFCAWLVDGFTVDSFVNAFIFSIILSVITWILNKFIE